MAIQGDVGLYLSGQPVPLEECNIIITPPKIKEIVAYGEDNFFMVLRILGKTNVFLAPVRQGNSQLDRYNDFQLLLVILNEEIKSKRLVESFFELVFPNYNVRITNNSIDFLIEERTVGRISPFSFESFQNVLVELFEPAREGEGEEYNPVDDKAREIAEKLKRGKEKREALKNNKNKKVKSLFGNYISVLSIGTTIDINVLYNYTPFQLYDAFTRFLHKMQSDFYQSISIQPFMDTSKIEAPEEWYGELY